MTLPSRFVMIANYICFAIFVWCWRADDVVSYAVLGILLAGHIQETRYKAFQKVNMCFVGSV